MIWRMTMIAQVTSLHSQSSSHHDDKLCVKNTLAMMEYAGTALQWRVIPQFLFCRVCEVVFVLHCCLDGFWFRLTECSTRRSCVLSAAVDGALIQFSSILFCLPHAALPAPVTNCSVSNHTRDMAEIHCSAGYDGNLPQLFQLEMVSKKTKAIR